MKASLSFWLGGVMKASFILSHSVETPPLLLPSSVASDDLFRLSPVKALGLCLNIMDSFSMWTMGRWDGLFFLLAPMEITVSSWL